MFKHITRTVWLLSLVSLFNDFSSEMLYPIIPLFLQQVGFGSLVIGILEGITEFIAGMAKLVWVNYLTNMNAVYRLFKLDMHSVFVPDL